MISDITKKMICASGSNLHDINHFMNVHSYAKRIAGAEGIDGDTQTVLEIAALVHDIACPSLRDRYGHCEGHMQEAEGMPMTREFLQEFPLTPEQLERIVYLVGHHHSTENVDGPDYRILLEADFIVNAVEGSFSRDKITAARDSFFETESGKEILAEIFGI